MLDKFKKYKLYIFIWLFYFFVYFFTSPGSLGGDSQMRFEVAKNIANHFLFTLPDDITIDHYYAPKTINGKRVLFYPPLIQVLYAGTIKFSDFVINILGFNSIKNNIEEFFCALWGPIWGAFLLLGVFLILKRFSFSNRTSFFITIIAGLSTNLWMLIVNSSNNVAQAVFIIYGLYLFLDYYYEEKNNRLIMSGLMLGLGLLTRYNTIFYSFSFIIVFFIFYCKKYNFHIFFKKLVCFIYPQFIAGIIILISNYLNFGNPFSIGLQVLQDNLHAFEVPFLKGLLHVFFDSSYGIFPNIPHILLGLFIVFFTTKKKFNRFLNLIIIFSTIFSLFIIAKSFILPTAEYGPRYSIPFIILWILYLAYLIEQKEIFSIIFKIFAIFFIIIQFIATLTTRDRIYYQFNHKDLDKISRFNYRYCAWITQVEGSISVLCNLPNIKKDDLYYNMGNVERLFFEKHSVAFNFIIYWWVRLYFLNVPLIGIAGIGMFFILIIFFLYKEILSMIYIRDKLWGKFGGI